jgi:hypothetical protein
VQIDSKIPTTMAIVARTMCVPFDATERVVAAVHMANLRAVLYQVNISVHFNADRLLVLQCFTGRGGVGTALTQYV